MRSSLVEPLLNRKTSRMAGAEKDSDNEHYNYDDYIACEIVMPDLVEMLLGLSSSRVAKVRANR